MLGRIKYTIIHLDGKDKRIPDLRKAEIDESLHTYFFELRSFNKENKYLVYGTGKNSSGSVRAFPLFTVPDIERAREICENRNNGNGKLRE